MTSGTQLGVPFDNYSINIIWNVKNARIGLVIEFCNIIRPR